MANGEGVIYGWTSGNKDIQAWIPTSANDMDILARIRLSAQNPTGANYQARIVARAQTDARNGYTAVITHTTAGAVKWSLNRVVNAGGSGTLTLGSGTLLSSGAANTKWWIRLDAQGTQIKVRFWQDGTTEPTTWKANASDSQWTSGRPALGVYVGSGLTSPYPDTGFDNYTATALNLAPTIPSAPNLSSAAGGSASVTLQWSAPVSDGGSAITGYNIYRGTASGGETLLTQVGNVTSYTDTSVTNGATYYYKVSAVNAVGESALSNELSASPLNPRADRFLCSESDYRYGRYWEHRVAVVGAGLGWWLGDYGVQYLSRYGERRRDVADPGRQRDQLSRTRASTNGADLLLRGERGQRGR